jgi:hypothetical protein
MDYVGQWGGGGPGHSWALKWQRAKGEIHNEGPLKGWALKSRLFGPLNGHKRSDCHFGPNSYVQSHIRIHHIHTVEFILQQSADLVREQVHSYEFITHLFPPPRGPL